MDSKPSDLKRRVVLKTVGAGIALPLASGVAAANNGNGGGGCEGCPDGTTLLAKYEFNEDSGEFEPEEGTGVCPEAIDITSVDDRSDPHFVEYTSSYFVDGIVVKAGPECEEQPGTNDKKDGLFEGEAESDDKAISHISFCTGACFQVDLVEGDPIVNLGDDEDGLYSDGEERKIQWKWGGTNVEGTPESGDNTDSDGNYTTNDGDCTLTVKSDLTVDSGGDTASVTFEVEVEDGTDGCELSLVSYIAHCPPDWADATDEDQVLFDADPDYDGSYIDETTTKNTFDEDDEGEHTLTVALPGLEDLHLLCDS